MRDGDKTVGGHADVVEADFGGEDLLHDEGRNGARELRRALHDAEAERHDVRREQELDDLDLVGLDERADDAEAGQAEELVGFVAGRGVEERV